jgi:hypothetical protein
MFFYLLSIQSYAVLYIIRGRVVFEWGIYLNLTIEEQFQSIVLPAFYYTRSQRNIHWTHDDIEFCCPYQLRMANGAHMAPCLSYLKRRFKSHAHNFTAMQWNGFNDMTESKDDANTKELNSSYFQLWKNSTKKIIIWLFLPSVTSLGLKIGQIVNRIRCGSIYKTPFYHEQLNSIDSF